MARGRNKYQSRENRIRVSQPLLREWDPIGVYGDGAEDEYGGDAAKAYVMLMDEGARAAEIAEYPLWAATERVGLLPASERQDVAELLSGIRAEFQTH